jgi:hypothetical protein
MTIPRIGAFAIILPVEAYLIAEKFQCSQDNSDKARKVYRNTLAVCAVNLYLQNLGFETDLETSDSWDFLMQTLMDVADLEVKNCGKIECRPVLPDEEFIYIPAETWFESDYCIAVELNEITTEAKLLGFVEKVTTVARFNNYESVFNQAQVTNFSDREFENYARETFAVSQLRSLEELPSHLHRSKTEPIIPLSQWFAGNYPETWQALDKTLVSRGRYEFLMLATRSRREPQVTLVKEFDFGLLLNKKSVALVITIQQEVEEEGKEETNVLVQVIPMDRDKYLPPSLKLRVCLESDIAEVEARSADNLIGCGSCHNMKIANQTTILSNGGLVEQRA